MPESADEMTVARLVDRDWFSAVAPGAPRASSSSSIVVVVVVVVVVHRSISSTSVAPRARSLPLRDLPALPTPSPPHPHPHPIPIPASAVGVLQSKCEPIIAGDHAGGHAAFLASLRASAPTSPCTRVWMAGAVAYRCRTCQTGEQSSVCVRCFKSGDHDGHDYIMYRSETGGVCDCGDVESWAREGCCPAHRPSRDDDDDENDVVDASDEEAASSSSSSSSLLPKERRDAAVAVYGVVCERLLLALESVARMKGPTRPPAAGGRRAEARSRLRRSPYDRVGVLHAVP